MYISLKLSFCQFKICYILEVNLKANLLNTVLHFKPLEITTFKPLVCIQHIAANFGKFDKSSLIRQTKIIQISTYNYVDSITFWLNLFIHSPNFFCQMLKMSKFTKLLPCQAFPLYGTVHNLHTYIHLIDIKNELLFGCLKALFKLGTFQKK